MSDPTISLPKAFESGYVLPKERGTNAEKKDIQGREGRFHAQYIVGKKLGMGAFAQVYGVHKAEKPTSEELAVKVMDNREVVNGNPVDKVDDNSKDTIANEVEILRMVRKWDCCIKMTDSYIDGLYSYIVMEKCDLTLLRAIDSMPALTEVSLADLLRQALASLCCIHAVDVVHRDIKPDNYLVKNGVVKLCDFGMAELVDAKCPKLTGVFGTAPYMSPEMVKGDEYDAKTDVWSYACMAYVLFLGKFPYQPEKANSKAMKAAIMKGATPDFAPKSGLPRISECVTDYLRFILVRDVDERPSAMEALACFGDAGHHCDGVASLRPMLYAAKRAGAFNAPKLEGSENDLDDHVRYLQAKYHGKNPAPRIGKVRSRCKGSRVAVADLSTALAV